ncbi:MAG: glycosyltransferase family 4 protein [Ahniella sp.]|nr:glycosyltransferase family 4 protein [Ahniella sp.]
MRLLVIATDVWGRFGGIAQYNRDLLEALAVDERIHRIDVLSLNPCDDANNSKIKVRHAGGNRLKFVMLCLSMSLRREPGILLCAHINFIALARMMKWLSGLPVWLQIHGLDAWTRPAPSRERACRETDLVTVVSRCTRHRFLAWSDIDPDRVRVVPNTVQLAFKPGARNSTFRKSLGIELESSRMLLTVSRLSHFDQYKGVDKVIAALPNVRKQYPDAIYCIAGDGDDIERLRSEAKKHGVHDFVKFLGAVGDQNLLQVYREADLFVMPSTNEGFGIVFLEATASGTPALGLGSDGSVDALLEGKLGIISSAECLPQDICAALAKPWSPGALSSETHARFGKPVFAENIQRVVTYLHSEFPEHVGLRTHHRTRKGQHSLLERLVELPRALLAVGETRYRCSLQADRYRRNLGHHATLAHDGRVYCRVRYVGQTTKQRRHPLCADGVRGDAALVPVLERAFRSF